MAIRAELGADHPILDGFLPGRNLDLLVSLTKFSAPVTLRRVLAERVNNAEALQAELATNPGAVWQMAPIVEAQIAALELSGRDPDAVLARDLFATEVAASDTTRTLISVLSLGLVGAGLATSGPAGWVVAGAGVAADGADAAVFAQQYGLRAAAARIDVDAGRSLTHETVSRGTLVFEGLILGAAATGFAVGDLARLGRAADGSAGAHFFAAVGRQHDEATRLATYAVFEQHGLLGELHRLTDGAAELAARNPGRLASLASDNPSALFGSGGEVGAELLEMRMVRLEALGDTARRRVSASELEGLLDFSPRALRDADPAALEELSALRRELGPVHASALVDAVGRRNLAPIAEHVDLARVAGTSNGRVVVDGVISLNGYELARMAKGGELTGLLDRARRLNCAPSGSMRMTVNPKQLTRIESLADRLRNGDQIPGPQLSALAGELGVDPVRLRYRLEAMAGGLEPLSEELAALARAHPGLEDALRTVDRLGVDVATRSKLAGALDGALSSGRFDLENLSDHLMDAAKSSAVKVDAAIGELQHGLRVVEKGDLAEGSKVWLGLQPGKTADLGRGTKVSLPLAKRGALQDIDVLYLRSDGVVQAVEVKRQPSTLKQKLVEDSDYLAKFTDWRGAASGGERREVAMAFTRVGEGLDDVVTAKYETTRQLLTRAKIAIRWPSW